ncbi:ATP-binding protein [Spirilliplanes yamanashiensis]|uniref:Histidine kinase/HSP90-like ATPase domain-containing protein n=1 Tax=Spirilliplanes yamanashiensis TaxID=42233 RepID=A0A8J3YD47_9ACTN|nr:ATP-binding protein [Spirilliplanes yamanashiensis]MDP9819113.1 anti-sigma regulatory factor (Ser/Thr protein kinase) [Spirilliplanes yamanashiensis]GIJ05567.1 hypothetical protein Sya03_49190 [Spirilliplanes yamanashiensis]
MTAPEHAFPADGGPADIGLPVPAPPALSEAFTAETVSELRHRVQACARRAGLTGDPLDDFVVAVHELTTNAVRHGGGRGHLHLRLDDDNLVCDVTDHGPGFAAPVPATSSRPAPLTVGGRGLWLAQQLTDTLLISDGPDGVTATVTLCLPARPAPAGPLTPATAALPTAVPTALPTAQPTAQPPAPPTVLPADEPSGDVH